MEMFNMNHAQGKLQQARVGFALLLTCLGGVSAAGQGIVVTKIAESSATGGLGLSVPSINNLGTVAFVDTTAGHTGLFTGMGGALTTIDTTSNYSSYSPGNGSGLNVSINDNGRIAAVVGVPQ